MELSNKSEALEALETAVSNLRDAVKDGGWSAIVAADIAFHEQLVNSVDSKRLTRMFRTLAAETRLCMNALVEHPAWVKRAVSDHRELLAALRGDDVEKMLQLLDAHLSLEDYLTYHGDTQAPSDGSA